LGSKDRVADYLAGADLVVSTSDSEGIPAAFVEANLMGIPVVAMNVGGVSELVVHRDTGWLCPPGDLGSMVRTIEGLIQDRGSLVQTGQRAKNVAIQRFSMDQVGAQYRAFYEGLLA